MDLVLRGEDSSDMSSGRLEVENQDAYLTTRRLILGGKSAIKS